VSPRWSLNSFQTELSRKLVPANLALNRSVCTNVMARGERCDTLIGLFTHHVSYDHCCFNSTRASGLVRIDDNGYGSRREVLQERRRLDVGALSSGQVDVAGLMGAPGGDWIVNAMDPQGAAFSLQAKKAQ
jgi:hypothetical protein